MAFSRGEIYNIIHEDLVKMEGHLETVPVGYFAKKEF